MIKNIIKRVIVGILIGLFFMTLSSCKVKAIQLETNFYINNTLMNSNTRAYTPGDTNVNLSIRTPSGTSYDGNLYTYGYIALCSSSASYDSRYISTISSPYMKNVSVVNSTVGCTIPDSGTSYINYARVLYITYEIPLSRYNIGTGNANFIQGNIDFSFYIAASDEFSLINYGFSYEAFNFNDTVDLTVRQNNSIISGITQVFQSVEQYRAQYESIQAQLQQALEDTGADISNTMKDESVSSPYNDINNAKNNVASNGVITNLVTLPITLFQNILNAISGSCQSFNLGTLFNYNLTMPCINLQNILGNTLFTIIDIICSGFFVYFTGRKMIDIFNNLSQLKEGDLLK